MSLMKDGQYEPLDKYLPHAGAAASSLSLPQEIIGGAVATVADIGTTYWNSLTPEKYNVQTSDLLARIDKDALQVYNENTDTIQTLSFIGGLVAPVGLSIKGMNALRAGTKGYSWFTSAGQAAQLAKVEEAFAASKGTIDAAFIKAKWELYRGVAYNAVADNVAAELAIIGTLSAHPYMEDYYKDFSGNFLKSVAFGTGIQTGIGSIIAKGQIKGAQAALEKEGNKLIKETLWDPQVEAAISGRSHLGEMAALHIQNLDNLKDMVAKAKDINDPFTLKPYTIARVEDTIMREESALVDRLKGASQGTLATFLETAPREVKDYFLGFIGRVENAGLDKIGFAEVKGTTKKLAAGEASGQLHESKSLWELVTKTLKDGSTKESIIKTDAIWTPLQGGRYIAKADAPYYLQMADLGQTIEQLEKGLDKRWGIVPMSDWGWELGALPTAQLDAEYAQAVLWAQAKVKDAASFNKLVVDPDHLPLLKALHTRAQEILKEDPTAVLNIKLTKEPPTFGAVQTAALARKGGVAANYVTELVAMEKDWGNYSLHIHGKADLKKVSAGAEKALADWISGGYSFLRNGVNVWRGLIPGAQNVLRPEAFTRYTEAAKVLDELYSSAPSQALRDSLRKLADADGNVWLYRGMREDPKGHRALESYTILPEKAAEFGNVKMYKVHVDDIVATVHDFGPTGKKPEILAVPPTRDFAEISRSKLRELPDELLIEMPEVVQVGAKETAVVTGLKELETTLVKSQEAAISNLRQQGFGVETIALKTGTPIETVEAFLSGDPAVRAGAGLIKYGSRLDVEQALQLENRALALSTDMNKIPQPELFAKLNAMNLDNSSEGILEFYLRSSPSEFVRQTADALLSTDMRVLVKQLYDNLGEATGSGLKSSMFASTNQVTEALGPVGSIANVIGKEVINIKNALKEKFEEPIANLMGQVIKGGEATLIEANAAFNVNASISGRRLFKDGSFWVPSKELGLADFRQALKLSDEEFRAIAGSVDEGEEALFTKATLNGKEFNVATAEVKEMLERLQDYGREMYDFKNAYMRAVGKQELGDIGFWAPSFNPRNKSIAYVHNLGDNTTSMLYADNDELLASAIKSYEGAMSKKHGANWEASTRIITKNNQEAYNNLAGRHDSLYMQAADLTKQHGGSSASTLVPTDTTIFKDILQGYQNHVSDGVEKIVELQLNQTMNQLKNLSDMSQGLYSPATKGILQKLSSKPVDAGQTLRNILLGRPLLSEHKAWGELQQRGQVYTDLALKTVTELFEPLLAPGVGKISGTKVRSAEDWKNVLADMESKGITNPFAPLDRTFGLERYLTEGKGANELLTPRAITLGNGLAATTLLRVLELAQPLVNALSLPILTSAAVNRRLASSFMGATLDPSAKFATVSSMYEGIRLMNHPVEGLKWSKIGEAKGLFSMELRNVTELLEHQRSLDPGILTAVEKGLDSSLTKMLSKPADFSESFVRRSSFFTGVNLAKKAYPGLSDTGIYTFARNFMDEAVGNYTAAQRPAMFQGTFGVAMGLFQTYMLTLAQNMYRQVEHKDWASLGKLLLTQSGIFGASSLPGFHFVSEQIAKNFSDQNFDLQTGTFRAIDDRAANVLLYGLPSSLGPGVVTRGDIQPRLPNPFQGISSLALVNMTEQAYAAGERVASAAWNADESAGKAMLEALSLQSISRPVARTAELLAGRSITSRGDIVQQGSEIYTTQGIFSRVMATRPLEEIKAREALHLNTVYGQMDAEKRRAVTTRLKSHIRNGDLSGETLDKLASEYLRTGSSNGWRAAVSDAVKQAGQSGDATTLAKLKPQTALHVMIDDLD